MKKISTIISVLYLLASTKAMAVLKPGNPAERLFIGTEKLNGFKGIFIFILDILFQFVGIVATIYLIVGAYYYMTSGGNEELAKKGKKMIFSAIVGVAVAVLSYAILRLVENTLRG